MYTHQDLSSVYNEHNKSHDLHRFLDHSSPKIRRIALEHPNVNKTHIMRGLFDKDNDVRHAALFNHKSDSTVVTSALHHPNPEVRLSALDHVDLNKSHVRRALNDPDSRVSAKANTLKSRFKGL